MEMSFNYNIKDLIDGELKPALLLLLLQLLKLLLESLRLVFRKLCVLVAFV